MERGRGGENRKKEERTGDGEKEMGGRGGERRDGEGGLREERMEEKEEERGSEGAVTAI